MSARNLTALGFSVGIGVITGSFSPFQQIPEVFLPEVVLPEEIIPRGSQKRLSQRRIRQDMISQVLRNPTGVYIFKPTLQEQQRASEFWRKPGYVISDRCSHLGPLVDLKQRGKSGQCHG